MPRINLLPDDAYLPDVPGSPAHGLEAAEAEAPLLTSERTTCPGCLGKGRYVGFMAVEDPCRFCNGSGACPPTQ